jgi:DNA-binding transcriptional ArsR family regulator
VTAPEQPISPDELHTLDYEIEDAVVLSSSAQLKAIANGTRSDILNLLSERAATVSQLADSLATPKGTIGYHTKVLEDAGLIRVVRTNQVRAMTEKYYGRIGRTIVFGTVPKPDDPLWFVNDALKHMNFESESPFPMFTSRVARIPEDHVVAFSERILEMAEEFLEIPRDGDTVYGFLAGVFPTDHPAFKEDGERT